MSTEKYYNLRSGDRIPKTMMGVGFKKSVQKQEFAQPLRFTTDSQFYNRRVHTQTNQDEDFEFNRVIQKLGLTGLVSSKSPNNLRKGEIDPKQYQLNYTKVRDRKGSQGVTIQVPKAGMMITTNNLHQNIRIFTDGKVKRDSHKIGTLPEDKVSSKDKCIKKQNKKLFDRLLLSKQKNTRTQAFRGSKPKDLVDRYYDNSGTKQNQDTYKQPPKKESTRINFKQKLASYGFADVKKERKVFEPMENKKQSKKIKTEPCQLNKPQIQILEKVGEGTFGQVYKARLGNKIVAVKKVFQDRKYKNRQLQILNMIKNDFVLNVIDTFHTQQRGTKGEETKQYLNVVMQFYEHNLYEVNSQSNEPLTPIQIKLFTYQMFRGLMYIHAIDICHRDIKPQNLLVNRKTSRLVICDFGSAKKLIKGEVNIAYICSRCYRAPQLIFGCTSYTSMIDIWSAGCVLLQLLTGQPFFIGDSNIGQLVQIIKVLGTPSKTEVINMNPQYDLDDYKFPKVKTKHWKQVFPKIDPDLQSFLKQLMIYSPKQRLNAAQALCHEYFDELRQQSTYRYLRQKNKICPLFNFTQQQLNRNQHLAPKLIPDWYDTNNIS